MRSMRTYNRSTIITLALLGVILIVASYFAYRVYIRNYNEAHKPDIALIQSDTAVPYKDMSGGVMDLSVYKDHPLIVNAWATWSPFSENELTTLSALAHEYGDAFTVIAINRKESPATIAAYLSQIDDTSGVTFIQDETDHFFNTVTGFAMPETMFYNKEGKAVVHVRGVMTEAEMRENIEVMLKEVNEQ